MAEEIFSLTPINSGRNRSKACLTLRKSKIKKEIESFDHVKAECTQNSLENFPPQIAKKIEKPRLELAATDMSQSAGKLESNSSAVDKRNLFPRTNGIRVKVLDELSNYTPSEIQLQSLDPKPVISEIIELSSEEESLKDFKPSTRKTRRKQPRSPQTPNTLARRKLRGKRNVKTEVEKVTIIRKLTKSTNLKTFSSKYQPASQKSIEQYFKSVDRIDRVGYYETFEKSSVRKSPKLQPVNLIEKFEQVENVAAAPSDPQWNTVISKDSLIDEETRANLPQFLKFLESSYKHSGLGSGPQSLVDFDIFLRKSANLPSKPIFETDEMEVRPDVPLSETQSAAVDHQSCQKVDCSSQKLFESSGAMSSQSAFGRVRKRLTFDVGNKIENEQLQAPADEIIDLFEISSTEEDQRKVNDRCKSVPTTTTGTSKKSRDKRKAGCMTPIKKDKRKRAECPAYKIIENTTFAVDAFRYGEIDGISHYFLSHFHADHYIGLSKKFQRPVYLSEISASLVRTFLRTRSEYLHVINIDEPININGVEIVAVDANHCPGALMFIFKFDTGLCTLHTGDFRASPEMEEGPIFWNYRIHTIYLDTTYLSSKYMFKSQSDSIFDAICAIHDFRERHIGEKILYVFGSYVIGKEKMWTKLADDYNWRIWTDENRRKALDAIGNREFLKRLVNDPHDADMHILTIGNLSYDYLSQYLNQFCEFSMIFGIRASGWEKNSKPQYRGRVNIFGVEYSEHSSYEELRRFVQFVQPTKIISTVPTSSDMSRTSKIPRSWYNNKVRSRQKAFQSSITNFIRVKDKRNKLAESTSRAINEIDRAKLYDSGSGGDMLAIDATLTTPRKDGDVIDSVFDWML